MDTENNRPDIVRNLMRLVLPFSYLSVLFYVNIAFLRVYGSGFFLGAHDIRDVSLRLFPLFGINAMVFVWMQTLVGPNIRVLRTVHPNILKFHKFGGVAALLFAVIHPTLLLTGIGLRDYLSLSFVRPGEALFVYAGMLAVALIVTTAITALFLRVPLFRKYWRRIHYLNYAVFLLAWTHSWFLGEHIRSSAYRNVWIFFLLSFILSLLGRVLRAGRERNEMKMREKAGSDESPVDAPGGT